MKKIIKNEAPVFPQTMHRLRAKPNAVAPGSTLNKPGKAKKRDNIFSKSKDIREDRGERQMKSQNPQTFPHGR